MRKRILTMLAAAALCLAIIAGFIPAARAFSDLSDAELSLAAETLAGMGIVSGGGDGNYYPDLGLTRAQFCKMAVLAEGHGDQVSSSAYKSLFSDVPSASWAAPYVNLAYSEKLIAGYGNGLFGPDDGVTVSQAVTIALHLLGYQNSDIGPFWPEDYMAKGRDLGLLDGISSAADGVMTRGEAARMLYRMLSMNTAHGKPFYQGLAVTAVSGAILLDSQEITVYAGNTMIDYTAATNLPAALVGERGTLLLDSAGRAVGFLPDSNLRKTVTVSSVNAGELNGITIPNTAALLLNEERLAWENGWYDLRKGDEVILYYSAAGTIDFLWVKTRAAGSEATITGYYEDATPNTAVPSTVTVLGAALSVTDEGRAALKGYSVGDKLTVTLNADGKVTGAVSAASSAAMVGVLKSASTAGVEVELLAGITVSGKPYSAVPTGLTGHLVKVSAPAAGKLSVGALSYTSVSTALEGLTLADGVRIYERVNGSALTEISLDDIPVGAVSAADILHAGVNAAGEVNLLVLDDVTGACYTYGILNAGEKQGGSGTMTYTNKTVSVENSKGAGSAFITGLSFTDGAVGGVAENGEGKAAAILILTAAEGLTRADFSASDSVANMPLAEDVQVYNATTGKWTTLSAAKAFTDSFTAYYDTHGIVRVIFAK